MKKILFAAFSVVAVGFASCGNQVKSDVTKTHVDSVHVDSLNTDSTVAK